WIYGEIITQFPKWSLAGFSRRCLFLTDWNQPTAERKIIIELPGSSRDDFFILDIIGIQQVHFISLSIQDKDKFSTVE
ncbi:MAG TPA: hypothetical protein VGZ71_15690, partial [Puia sp.]|nr:hypothetical protein [Puia sp.]